MVSQIVAMLHEPQNNETQVNQSGLITYRGLKTCLQLTRNLFLRVEKMHITAKL